MYSAMKRFSNLKEPEKVLNKVEKELVPRIRELPGFIAYYAVKFDNGDHGPVAIFETKENVDNWLEQTGSWLKQNLPDIKSEIDILRGEVMFSAAGKTIARSA